MYFKDKKIKIILLKENLKIKIKLRDHPQPKKK